MNDVVAELARLRESLEKLEFRRMFSGEMDASNAFLDIVAGSGGTEAQDWANMLLRMYLRWAAKHGFDAEIVELTEGEVAGIKSATVHIRVSTPSAGCALRSACTAWCARARSTPATAATPRSPRCSPRRKSTTTSRSRSTGGPAHRHLPLLGRRWPAREHHRLCGAYHPPADQHRGELPERTLTARQQGPRVQDVARQVVRAGNAEASRGSQALEDTKSDIGWGHQIRSYVLDQSRIKDLRTGIEESNCDAVLDGDLDEFIEASLKQGL